MKKNWIMRVALIVMVLTLATACLLNGTFAKYVTTSSGQDSARVAHWGFTAPTTVSLDVFKAAYTEGNTADAASSDTSDIIAPGTTNTATVKLINLAGSPEVAFNLAVSTTGSTIADDIKNNESIQWAFDYATDADWGTWDQMLAKIILKLSGDASGSKNYAPNTEVADIPITGEHTISWRWKFENNVTFKKSEPSIGTEPVKADWDVKWYQKTGDDAGTWVTIEGKTKAEAEAELVAAYQPTEDDYEVSFNGTAYSSVALAQAAYEALNPDATTGDPATKVYNFVKVWNNSATAITYAEALALYDNLDDESALTGNIGTSEKKYPTLKYKGDGTIADTEYKVKADAEAAYAKYLENYPLPTELEYMNGTKSYDLFGTTYSYDATKAEGSRGQTYAELVAALATYAPDAYDWTVNFNGTNYADYATAKEAQAALKPDEKDFTCTWNGATMSYKQAKDAYAEIASPLYGKDNAKGGTGDDADYTYPTYNFTTTGLYSETAVTYETYSAASTAYALFEDTWNVTEIYNAYNNKVYANYAAAKTQYDSDKIAHDEWAANKAAAESTVAQDEIDTEMGNKSVEKDGNVILDNLDKVVVKITITATQIDNYEA